MHINNTPDKVKDGQTDIKISKHRFDCLNAALIIGPSLVYAGLGKELPKPLMKLTLITGVVTIAIGLNDLFKAKR